VEGGQDGVVELPVACSFGEEAEVGGRRTAACTTEISATNLKLRWLT
jgi:hypothetical protein